MTVGGRPCPCPIRTTIDAGREAGTTGGGAVRGLGTYFRSEKDVATKSSDWSAVSLPEPPGGGQMPSLLA